MTKMKAVIRRKYVPFNQLVIEEKGIYSIENFIGARRIMYWHGGRALVGRSDELGGARFSLIWPRVHAD